MVKSSYHATTIFNVKTLGDKIEKQLVKDARMTLKKVARAENLLEPISDLSRQFGESVRDSFQEDGPWTRRVLSDYSQVSVVGANPDGPTITSVSLNHF